MLGCVSFYVCVHASMSMCVSVCSFSSHKAVLRFNVSSSLMELRALMQPWTSYVSMAVELGGTLVFYLWKDDLQGLFIVGLDINHTRCVYV